MNSGGFDSHSSVTLRTAYDQFIAFTSSIDKRNVCAYSRK